MVSAIDKTKPVVSVPTTASVRSNFTSAADEITAVQGGEFKDLSMTEGGLVLASSSTEIKSTAVLGDGVVLVGDGVTDPVSLAAFTSSTGTLKHESGGLEFDASAVANADFVVGTGAGTMGLESGATARSSLGVGTGNSPQFTSLTLSGGLTFSGANPEIRGGDTNGVTVISANTDALGAILALYGDTHASRAGDYEFRDDAGVVYDYDASDNEHKFGGTITGGTFVVTTNVIKTDENTTALSIYGGTTAADGAVLNLYPDGHANADDIEFVAASATKMLYDHSNTDWGFTGSLTVSGAVTGSNLSGTNTGDDTTALDFAVTDESADTTCFPVFVTAATGDLAPKSGTNLTFNSSTGDLTPTLLAGVSPATAQYTSAEETKLAGIETSADVTDSTNVLAALAGQALSIGTVEITGNIIKTDENTTALSIYGGTTAADGAVLNLYPDGHANADDIEFVAASATKMLYDHSNTDWGFTGNVTATGTLSGSDLTLGGANPDIIGSDTNGVLTISSNTDVLGGMVKFYGDTHASRAGDYAFLDDTTEKYDFDATDSEHTFTGAVTATGAVTGSNLSGTNTGDGASISADYNIEGGVFGKTESNTPFFTHLGAGGPTSVTGISNVAIGEGAAGSLTSGTGNVIIGRDALDGATAPVNAVAIGLSAMGNGNVSGVGNIAVGNTAGNDLTSGIYSVLVGQAAGANITQANNTIAIGRQTIGTGITIGTDNLAIGRSAGNNLTTGTYNVLIGSLAGVNITGGDYNIAIGEGALDAATTSGILNNNIAIGQDAMGTGVLDGDNNIAIGQGAGIAMTSALDNTIVGALAATSLTTGNNNTIIGQNAEPSGATVSNEVTIGDTTVSTTRVQVDWTILSDERDKTDIVPISDESLAFINALTPVTFKLDDRTWYYDEEAIVTPGKMITPEGVNGDGKIIPEEREPDKEKIIRHPKPRDGSKITSIVRPGLTAQDVMVAAAIHGNGQFDDIVNSTNPERLEYIPSAILFPLIKAVQELSAKNDALEARLTAGGL
ncbi:hypothetical protein LCGC14_0355210 [marine sediment metagenome]|uniref:Peptidase S74 domain-containing protein n=1 Tax=marine sediment metagenome TaxID=412755 RepID=A0A0F9VWX0_9ZZZZ